MNKLNLSPYSKSDKAYTSSEELGQVEDQWAELAQENLTVDWDSLSDLDFSGKIEDAADNGYVAEGEAIYNTKDQTFDGIDEKSIQEAIAKVEEEKEAKPVATEPDTKPDPSKTQFRKAEKTSDAPKPEPKPEAKPEEKAEANKAEKEKKPTMPADEVKRRNEIIRIKDEIEKLRHQIDDAMEARADLNIGHKNVVDRFIHRNEIKDAERKVNSLNTELFRKLNKLEARRNDLIGYLSDRNAKAAKGAEKEEYVAPIETGRFFRNPNVRNASAAAAAEEEPKAEKASADEEGEIEPITPKRIFRAEVTTENEEEAKKKNKIESIKKQLDSREKDFIRCKEAYDELVKKHKNVVDKFLNRFKIEEAKERMESTWKNVQDLKGDLIDLGIQPT